MPHSFTPPKSWVYIFDTVFYLYLHFYGILQYVSEVVEVVLQLHWNISSALLLFSCKLVALFDKQLYWRTLQDRCSLSLFQNTCSTSGVLIFFHKKSWCFWSKYLKLQLCNFKRTERARKTIKFEHIQFL